MPSRYFTNPQAEEAFFAKAESLRASRERYSQDANNALIAQRLEGMGIKAPWIRPDAALSLADGGMNADDPAFDRVAQAAGKKKSWFNPGDWVTAAKRKTGNALGAAFGGIARNAGNVARPALRTADLALSAGYEEAQGAFRNVTSGNFDELIRTGVRVGSMPLTAARASGDAIAEKILPGEQKPSPDPLGGVTDWALKNSQSRLGVASQQVFNNQRVDLGQGFFASGKVAEQQRVQARSAGSIDGHAVTPGRWLANQTRIIEPGTKPYNLLSGLVDASIAIGADPSSKVLGAVGKGRQASKLFVDPDARAIEIKEAAGAVVGNRKDIIPDRVQSWITSEPGSKVIQFAADNDFKTLRKTLGNKIEAKTLVDLADAKSTDEVIEILRPKLGIDNGLREKPELPGRLTAKNLTQTIFRKDLDNMRIAKMMPGSRINLDDHDDAVEQIDRFAANAKLPEDVRWRHVENMARADSKPAMLKATEDLMTDVATDLEGGAGLDKNTAKKLTRLWADKNAEETKYWIDAISGENMPVPGAAMGLEGKVTPTPHRYNEMINSAIPLPDAREIRTQTSKWGRLLKNTEIKRTLPNGKEISAKLPYDQTKELGDYVVQLWKGSVLIRAAYTLRVEGEAQMRLAGARYDSMLNHPLQALGFITGRKGRLGVAGEDIVDESKLASEVDEYAASLAKNYDYKPWGGNAAGHRVETFDRDMADAEDFVDAWADTIHKARSDEPTRRVVGDWDDAKVPDRAMAGSNIEKTKLWGWEGEGAKLREEMGSAPGREALLQNRASWDEYVDSLLTRVDGETNANPELIQAIATGKFRGEPIREGFKTNENFRKYLREQVDQGNAPQKVRGQKELKYEKGKFHPMENLDRVIDAGFNFFASKPANTFSRSPMFLQANWNRATELLPFASKEAQEAIIANARTSKLPSHVLKQLDNAKTQGFGELDVDEVDQLSKLYALGEVKNRLYDLGRRSQFFDMYRLAFPFGDAWLEVLNSWRHIVTENPATIRRGQQTITGAREADPDGDGQGFFYKDPTTGEEMYTMPFSKYFTEGMMRLSGGPKGMGAPYSSPVKGLNIFGTIVPGFGPAVQVPAGALIPDEEEWDEVHQLFLPMGQASVEGGAYVEQFWPAWLKKIATGVDQFGGGTMNEKHFNDSVTNIAAMLFDQGKYNFQDPDENREAFEEARRLAPRLWIMRGVAQYATPSPPSPEFLVHDENGRMVMMDYLINDLRDMQEAKPEKGYGDLEYKDVTQKFLQKYGLDSLLLLEGKTENVRGNLPVTADAKNWARSNPDLSDKYSDVYGFFAPQGGEFDIDAYSRQLRSGERKGRTPEEVKDAVEAELGNMIWRQIQDQVKGRDGKSVQQWKQTWRDTLEKQFPGFANQEINLRNTPATISKLELAVADPRLAKTNTGRGLTMYFELRDKALEKAKKAGMDPTQISKAKKAKSLRTWLRQHGEAMAAENRDFSNVWERVLSREVEEPKEDG